MDCPIQMYEGITILTNDAGAVEKVKAIEKKFLSPLIGLIRSGAEIDLKLNQRHMSLSPQEQENLQIPIYEYDSYDEGFKITGYRPFNREECQNNINILNKAVTGMVVGEVVVEIGLASKVIGVSLSAFNLLTQRMLARAISRQDQKLEQSPKSMQQIDCSQADIVSQEKIKENGEEETDIFDLRQYQSIPPELENDEFFRNFNVQFLIGLYVKLYQILQLIIKPIMINEPLRSG